MAPVTRPGIRAGIDRLLATLSRQSGRNAVFSGGSFLVIPVAQIAATPILFHAIGTVEFGVWALINAVITASGMANLGLNDAATKYVAMRRARDAHGEVIVIVQTVIALSLALGLVVAVGLWSAARWIAESGFGIENPHLDVSISAIRIASVGVVVRGVYGAVEASIRGYDRFDLESVWGTAGYVLGLVFAIVSVHLGGDLRAVVASTVVGSLAAGLGCARVLRSLIGDWAWLRPRTRWQVLREVSSFSAFTWLQNVNGFFVHQFDRIAVGVILGPGAAGIYAVCVQLVQAAHGVLARSGAFLLPLVVRLKEQRATGDLWRLYREGMLLTTLAGWLLSGGLAVFGAVILRVWMGGEFALLAGDTLFILAIWNSFLATTVMPYYFLNATGGERMNAGFSWLGTGILVSMALILTPAYGTIGAASARLISLTVHPLAVIVVFRRLFPDQRWHLGLSMLIPTLLAVLVVLAGRLLQFGETPTFLTSIGVFVASALVCAGSCLLLNWFGHSARGGPFSWLIRA